MVSSVTFSPDDKYIASNSQDNTAKIFDSKTGYEVQVLKKHTAYVNKVCFSKNGKFLATCSFDRTIKIWTKIKYDLN